MTSTDQIKILTWNVRGFNSKTTALRDEILRHKPHIVILQDSMKWIDNETDLGWSGSKVLNMEAIQQLKGRRGGLAVIVSPELEFTEKYRCAVGIDFEAQKESLPPPEHTELVNLFNVENALPEGDVDVSQQLAAEIDAPIQRQSEDGTQPQESPEPKQKLNNKDKKKKRGRRSKKIKDNDRCTETRTQNETQTSQKKTKLGEKKPRVHPSYYNTTHEWTCRHWIVHRSTDEERPDQRIPH